jgi:hypothetical protein
MSRFVGADVRLAAHMRLDHGASWATIRKHFGGFSWGEWPEFRRRVEWRIDEVQR